MTDEKGLSLAEQVFRTIEMNILDGTYPSGETLTEARLCADLGVSRTPVREAVRRLEQEGLMESSGKGAMVSVFSMDDISDIYEVRMRIEGLAGRRAAERITEAQLAKLTETVELQEFYIFRGKLEKAGSMDSEFHGLLYEICGSRILQSTLNHLHHRILYFRKMSMSRANRAENAVREHRAILEAVRAHDPERTEALIREHLHNAFENIRATVKL